MGHYHRWLYKAYDLDSTSLKYARYEGRQQQGRGTMSTSGSSTTISIAGSGGAPLGVGDLLEIYDGETLYERKVVTAGISSIVVDAAITLSGTPAWHFRKWKIGTGNTDGWVRARHRTDLAVLVDWATKAADGLDISIESKRPDGTPFVLLTKSYTAVGDDEIVLGAGAGGAVRVGVKGATTVTGTDVINISLVSRHKTGE